MGGLPAGLELPSLGLAGPRPGPRAQPHVCTGIREMDGLSYPPFLPRGPQVQQARAPSSRRS